MTTPLSEPTSISVPAAGRRPPADVCIIVEGCYPYVPGGVSSWIDWLIRSQPGLRFAIVALWPRPTTQAPRYALPDNVVGLSHIYLQDFGAAPRVRLAMPPGVDGLAAALNRLTTTGGIEALWDVTARLGDMKRLVPLPVMFNSPVSWRIVQDMYVAEMPYGSFLHYFWAWRALLGGLFATLEEPLPAARVYHTISTGYAGVLASRAAIETGRPVLLTEHGIYTNERRIELLMADWIADNVDKGHALADTRSDLRDLWVRAFEAYARALPHNCVFLVDTYDTLSGVPQYQAASPTADAGRPAASVKGTIVVETDPSVEVFVDGVTAGSTTAVSRPASSYS